MARKRYGQVRGLRRLLQAAFCFGVIVCLCLCLPFISDEKTSSSGDGQRVLFSKQNFLPRTGRRLLVSDHRYLNPVDEEAEDEFSSAQEIDDSRSSYNCTPRSIEQFPKDLFTEEQLKQGAVILHVIAAFYMLAGLAVVCDDYFVESLEVICDVLKLQHDVAGATFMAAGSSAPELFTSIIGLFFAKSDVGIGTIVGSAVFNILFIIAICGLFAGMIVHLTWWPVTRDLTFYLISVLALVLVIVDEEIHWYEATSFLALYIVYIMIMYFNPRLSAFLIRKVRTCKERRTKTKSAGDEGITDDEEPLLNGTEKGDPGVANERTIVYNTFAEDAIDVETRVDIIETSGGLITRNSLELEKEEKNEEDEEKEVEEEEFESPWTIPKGAFKTTCWILMLPFTLLFFLTIPDCRRPGGCWRQLFFLTFTMSIIWIALLTYFMVWMVTIIGDTAGIPDTVMGLTFLAAGTSVPDAMASLFVARDGKGDMAVSNSVGSNVFDILVCLGLPWFIQTAIVSPASVVYVNSATLPISAVILFGTVLFLLVAVFVNRWRLDKKLGIVFILLYVVVITISCLFEMNVFGGYNPPPCPRSLGF